jgi:hypothetical protein
MPAEACGSFRNKGEKTGNSHADPVLGESHGRGTNRKYREFDLDV